MLHQIQVLIIIKLARPCTSSLPANTPESILSAAAGRESGIPHTIALLYVNGLAAISEFMASLHLQCVGVWSPRSKVKSPIC